MLVQADGDADVVVAQPNSVGAGLGGAGGGGARVEHVGERDAGQPDHADDGVGIGDRPTAARRGPDVAPLHAGVGDRGEDGVDAHLHGRLALEPAERVQADADDRYVVVMSVLPSRRRVRPERSVKHIPTVTITVTVVPVIDHKPTFCRICEPLCGMVATVEDGRLVSLRPDKDHPLSAGFACQKGIAFTEVVNDPDRVTTPLRRTADR